MKERMLSIIFALVSVLIALIGNWVYKWRNPTCKGKLPPGSMGLPLLGETLSFFTKSTEFNIHPFVKERIERYGPIFKTSLVGKPFIISGDEEFNHFIFQQEGRLFLSWYPDSFTQVLGSQNPSALNVLTYRNVKNLILSFFGIERLKEHLLPDLDQCARMFVHSWSKKPSIELGEAVAEMIFALTAKKLISFTGEFAEDLRRNFVVFIEGLISFPLNIPGIAYYKCMQGRENVMKVLKKILHHRRTNPEECHGDFFDSVIDEMKKENSWLSEKMALDLVFIMLFVSFETTSLVLTIVVKCLTDNPKSLNRLTEEHDEILRRKEDPESAITWEEYKCMIFSSQVINETVRLANIAPGIFRKAMEDVEIKGHTIPAGWGIMVCPPAVHLNPAIYEDPLAFNPWRWEGVDASRGTKNFIAFGGGVRQCVGANFSRIQMSIFLHHLVTKYRWELLKGGEIVRSPGVAFPNGFHIRIHERNK